MSSPKPQQNHPAEQDLAVFDESKKQFQHELEVLKSQTEMARQKTLASIKEGILKAKQDGLHQTLFPGTDLFKDMSQKQNQEQVSNANDPTPQIANAQEAMAYTDDHMKELINNMSNQLKSAMTGATQATEEAKKITGLANDNMKQAVQAEQSTINHSNETVQQEMLKAQEAVAKTINSEPSNEA
ncbi:hypothetical protein [Reichenbachiella versicolor]|uniref:hypothetical protein n=1 Tax=Reichenbachiella versicolor TaxID=1821036 RepID=UPI000D6DFC46|nr:hypothetical protein [Reichenbachiella versicolor]